MPSRLRLGVLATHPIQYHAPLFRALARDDRLDLRVFFAHRPSPEDQGAGFGVAFDWDVDLTSGYDHTWLQNRAARPSASTYEGCDTPEIERVVEAGHFDAFLVSGWHSRSYRQAMRACGRSGVPLLVRGDSQLSHREARTKRALKRVFYPFLLRRFAVCLSVGTRSEEYFRHYGAREVVRAPHFVDNEFFASRADASRREGAPLRTRLGVPESAFVVLFAGKLVDKKRPLDAIRAAARARRLSDVRVVIAGDGELRGACAAEADRLSVPIYFLGFLNQTEIPSAYAAGDVLVLPSDARETWGLVVNEAMAAGLPALVSESAGCAPDLIREGETGFSVPLGGVEQLGRRVAELATNAVYCRKMGEAARHHVQRFSVEAAAEGVIEGTIRASRTRR